MNAILNIYVLSCFSYGFAISSLIIFPFKRSYTLWWKVMLVTIPISVILLLIANPHDGGGWALPDTRELLTQILPRLVVVITILTIIIKETQLYISRKRSH